MKEWEKAILPGDALLDSRVNELEREYEAGHADPENSERLDEVHFQISGLLGKNNLNLLREYTDRLIEQISVEPCWFYRKGLQDAGRMGFGKERPG